MDLNGPKKSLTPQPLSKREIKPHPLPLSKREESD